MFTIPERSGLRDSLIRRAQSDPEISGTAIVGSRARGAEDRWSDIDLALQLADAAEEPAVVAAWTAWLHARHEVADTFDVMSGGVRYRVFLLASSLQLDLSFWPHDRFRATGPAFRLLFGTAGEADAELMPDVDHAIGMSWLYALHARSAIARGRLWQAVLMLDGLRDQSLTLACSRNGLNPWHGRGADALPEETLEALRRARAETVTRADLEQSLARLAALSLAEIEHRDPARAARLTAPFAAMIAIE